MAPKKATPAQAAVQDEELDVFEQFRQIGTATQVAIHREPGGKYLEVLPLEGLDEEMMRDRYGGGRFSLRPREDGRFMKGVPTRHVEIEGQPKVFPPALVPGADPSPELLRLRTEIDALKTVAGGQGGGMSGETWVAIATLLAPVFSSLVASAMEKPEVPDPIEMFKLFRKMAKDEKDEAVAESSPMDPVLEKLGLPLLSEIVELRKQGEAQPGAAGPKAVPPAPPIKRPTTVPELAQFVARWCEPHARRGTNPQLRAELFLEDLALTDAELYAQVVELSRFDNIMDHWVRLVPDVGLTREWHEQFITEVRELAADEPPHDAGDPEGEGVGDPAPEGGRGDLEDAAAHAEASGAGGS